MRADFHVHSTASDGVLSPQAIIDHANACGMEALALADHDSVEGLATARSRSHQLGIVLVPAVELSATYHGRDIHVLGFHVDEYDPALLRHLRYMREGRAERAEQMIVRLERAGFAISREQVAEIAQGGAVGRSHIARALVASGAVHSTHEAFECYLGRSRPFYLPKATGGLQDVVDVLRRAGGLPVLAHPGVSEVDDLIEPLVSFGLGGIEAFHASHDQAQRKRYARVAKDHGLLVTGGSDYHGPGAPGPELGSVPLPDGVAEALLRWPETRS